MAEPTLEYTLLGLDEGMADPDYYQLLRLPRFTNDAKVIQSATIIQYGKLQRLQNSVDYSQKVKPLELKLAEARATLLDPESRHEYNERLRESARKEAQRKAARRQKRKPNPSAHNKVVRQNGEQTEPWDLDNEAGDGNQQRRVNRWTEIRRRRKRARRNKQFKFPALRLNPLWPFQLLLLSIGAIFIGLINLPKNIADWIVGHIGVLAIMQILACLVVFGLFMWGFFYVLKETGNL